MSRYCSHHPAECTCSDEVLAYAAVPSLEYKLEQIKCGPAPIECGDDSTDDATGNHCPAHQEIFDEYGPEVEAAMNDILAHGYDDDDRDDQTLEEFQAEQRANRDSDDNYFSPRSFNAERDR
jgi:hypothetical protein